MKCDILDHFLSRKFLPKLQLCRALAVSMRNYWEKIINAKSEQLVKVAGASVDVIRSINFSNMNPYGAAAFATVGVAGCILILNAQEERPANM